MKLEELKAGMRVRGLVPEGVVILTRVERRGPSALEVDYRHEDDRPGNRLLTRGEEARLAHVPEAPRFDFRADGALFRLVAEAQRIRHAHLIDPHYAVHSSQITPLPHQLSAVYDHMLKRQPLRFLLADDAGAGKTIMAGLLIRELMIREAVRRCLICVPGNLALQWREEMKQKFGMDFLIFGDDTQPSAKELQRNDLLIARMDQLKRARYIDWLKETEEWDLVICDEAHKMSASRSGRKESFTQRYRLAELLGERSPHLLLLTATPHNGREADFRLFLRLLDRDRFAGDGHGQGSVDCSDLMRRMQKEELKNFDGSPLFVKRYATTLDYRLDAGESGLYDDATRYVREEFDRAERLADPSRRNSIGFALTILQRRLASSPRAIKITLARRRDRLRQRLSEPWRGAATRSASPEAWDEEELENLDEGAVEDVEQQESELSESASAALNTAELRAEIHTLEHLETQAQKVVNSGEDRKWDALKDLLESDDATLRHDDGSRRKLIIFTEFRDTLDYLVERLGALQGPDAVVQVHGGIPFARRREILERFRDDPRAHYLVATDAVGEGVNLQFAHLMINYDLPWNPNRIEQRFGRIHRIGQTRDCHLWNLISSDTREGSVFQSLLEKLETQRGALDGKVFNVLGELFREKPLRTLMLEAVRADDDSGHVERDMNRLFAGAREALAKRDVLAHDVIDPAQLRQLNAAHSRARVHRLQPLHMQHFTQLAFECFGSRLHERAKDHFEISHIPPKIYNAFASSALKRRYPLVCFDPERVHNARGPDAELLHAGHLLLKALTGYLLDLDGRERILDRGAVLVDESGKRDQPRLLLWLDQPLRDGRENGSKVVARKYLCLSVDRDGQLEPAGEAPWLDCRPPREAERPAVGRLLAQEDAWLRAGLNKAVRKASDQALVTYILPWLQQEKDARLPDIERKRSAIHTHLSAEIVQEDGRMATELQRMHAATDRNERQLAGNRHNQAQERREDLIRRLETRRQELELERDLNLGGTRVLGGALILPATLLGHAPDEQHSNPETERLAMQAVMQAERRLGFRPRDVSAENLGYDIESSPESGHPERLIEVKGRRADARDVTLTRNEIVCALNSQEQHILAVVQIDAQGRAATPRYLRGYQYAYPDGAAIHVKYRLRELLAQAVAPEQTR